MKPKTLSLKLSKRLNDLGLLNDIETEYCYYSDTDMEEYFMIDRSSIVKEGEYITSGIDYISEYTVYKKYKTLTLEEAIDFLAKQLYELNIIYRKNKISKIFEYHIKDITGNIGINSELILAIEQSIEYLLDNNLLTK